MYNKKNFSNYLIYSDSSLFKDEILSNLENDDIVDLYIEILKLDSDPEPIFTLLSKRKAVQNFYLNLHYDKNNDFYQSIIEFLENNSTLESFTIVISNYINHYPFKQLNMIYNLKNLKKLGFAGFLLSEENWKIIGKMIEENRLKELAIDNGEFDVNIAMIKHQLKTTKSLTKLTVNNDILVSKPFFKSLIKNKSLKKLNFNDCSIDILGIALSNNDQIQKVCLNASSNGYDLINQESIIEIIRNFDLKALELNYTSQNFSDDLYISVFNELKKKKNLSTLIIDLKIKTKKMEVYESLKEFLKESKKLKKLKLNLFECDDEFLKSFSQGLPNYSSIEKLIFEMMDMDNTLGIGDLSFITFGSLHYLSHLSFSNANLTKKDSQNLFKSLQDHSCLKELELQYNNLRDLGKEIGEFLSKNSHLEILYLDDTRLTLQDSKDIFTSLENNKTLKRLNMNSNEISLDLVSNLIQNNKSLTHLNFDEECKNSYDVLQCLVSINESLRYNYTLLHLNRKLEHHIYLIRNRSLIQSPFLQSMNFKDINFNFE